MNYTCYQLKVFANNRTLPCPPCAGLALFLSVPRHVFAQVQQVLFPLYFLTNAVLMLVAVVTYTRHHPTHLWDNHQMMQVSQCFVIDVLIHFPLPLVTSCVLPPLFFFLSNPSGSTFPPPPFPPLLLPLLPASRSLLYDSASASFSSWLSSHHFYVKKRSQTVIAHSQKSYYALRGFSPLTG